MPRRNNLDAYESPQSAPAPKWERIKRDPKQEAQGRAEADQEARNALALTLASERRAKITSGSRGEITADVALVCARIACGASLVSVAAELGVAADLLAAWLFHADRHEQYNTALRARADLRTTEIIDIADDLRIPAQDRRVMVEARQWEAKVFGREYYADKLPAVTDEPQVSIPAGDLLRAAVALAMQSGLGSQLAALMPVATQNARSSPVLADERSITVDKSAS